MTDEQQLQALLMAATELPDELPPPVQRLIRLGRRRRNLRAGLRTVTIGAVAALAVAAAPIIHALAPPRPVPPTSPGESGPSAAAIARYHWSTLPPSPLGARSNPVAAWTGKELLELGGYRHGRAVRDGAAFDPASGRWHSIAPVPGNVAVWSTIQVRSAWTGRQLFFFGLAGSCFDKPPYLRCPHTAGLYDPATNHWTTTVMPAAMDGAFNSAVAVWTGHDIVVATVLTSLGRLRVASYDPATGRWRVITPVLRDHPAREIAVVATSDRVIVWSQWDRFSNHRSGGLDHAGVDVLALSRAGRWRDATGQWPQHESVTSPVFTGRSILVPPGQNWCGEICVLPYTWFPGYFANPVTLRRSIIPLGPLDQALPAYVWTGRTIVAIDLEEITTGPGGRIRPDDMALYDPGTARWTRLAAAPGRPSFAAAPLWTGNELLALTDSGRLLAFER
jgi:hypothetical protein